ncbi:MAG: DUF2312 domain-containing protein [Sphingobium sp.]|nr:DUF2312 domain-containing protein [Sphingobium sp.]
MDADMNGGQSKTLLVGYVRRLKDIADQIGELQADMTEICKEAKSAGFLPVRLREVVSWLRKVDKHGREKVEEAEAIFDLYRTVIDGKTQNFEAMMNDARDRALLRQFAPDDQMEAKLSKSRQTMRNALAMAKMAKEARGR